MSGRALRAAAVALCAAAACAHGPAREAGGGPGGGEPARAAEAPARPGEQVGLASYYGKRHHGRRTASGSRFDMHAMTCAHRTAPFGTRLKVTSLESGKSVVVKVTDRGPFAGGRVVDLSYAAARKLGMVEDGVVRVRIEPVEDD
ncbi:rare lipoprotein A [Anaeromyxobacter dehalogenans 2CP-1]|uniref:Probable endolytic peptidoglycan transglycosylase RlpA n=1 Tax=Anaeromyxobacter dehalogenans (strain ATCC BAA-258 / DSM 21875 / 2CP-1) TaxID=455488 RepID=B8J9P6_ANAD2|nr:septal ring lytic transglycosylase RlpA family protein [Anaeromyxobacter dehalogenans]ACL67434.1 rare lipoprotein A [Anaeromyxobacter dehalogenans 2CP-1]